MLAELDFNKKKVTLIGLSKGNGMEIFREIRLVTINKEKIVFYEGMRRSEMVYFRDKLQAWVIVPGWKIGVDQHRLFRTDEKGFMSFTRQIFNHGESVLAYEDCLKQIEEKNIPILMKGETDGQV